MTKNKTEKGVINRPEDQTLDTAQPSSPYIEVDLEEFLHFLDNTNLTDKEKMDSLAVHWRVICELMSLGFEIHPVQQAKKACGKVTETRAQSPSAHENEVSLTGQFINENITEFTEPETARIGEGVTK